MEPLNRQDDKIEYENHRINDPILDNKMIAFLEKMGDWSKKCQELKDNLQEFADLTDKTTFVLVLGETGTGKSTLVNGLVGVDLEYFFVEEEGIKVIDCIDKERTRIGHTGDSETKFPYEIKDPQNPISYFDCCGFRDTNGAGDEIQNAFYIQTLANLLKRGKVILTISESSITGQKKTEIQTLFEQMIRLFSSLDFLKSSLYLVVTKGTEYPRRENIRYIEKRLRILTEDHSNPRIKEVVDALIENKRIGLFAKPFQEGPVEQVIFQDIISDLRRLAESEIGVVNLEISASARDFVNTILKRLNKQISFDLEGISEKILSQLCRDKVNRAESLTEINLFCGDLLSRIPQEFTRTGIPQDEVLNRIDEYADRIIEISQEYNIQKLVERCQELKKYLHYIHELLRISPDNTLDCVDWNEKAIILRRRISGFLHVLDEMKNDTLIFHGFLISAVQVRRKIAERNIQENLRRVEIYCLNRLFLDAGLTLEGVDLLIISPNWVISAPIIVNLSGKDQRKLPERNDNKDGNPGLPGGNSGNFLGVGRAFNNLDFLRLTLKGGRGGQGIKGRDGECGSAGADGDLALVKSRDEKVLISKEISYDAKSLTYSMLTWNATFHEVYESKGEPGGDGENGGRGGFGGLGGKGGRALLLIGEECYEFDSERLEIGDGERGQGGEN